MALGVDRAPDEVVARRRAICRACTEVEGEEGVDPPVHGVCGLCGCFAGSQSYDASAFARRFDGELIVMPGVGQTLTGEAVGKARAYLQGRGF